MFGRPIETRSTLFRTVLSPTPYGLPSLEIGGLQLSYHILSWEQLVNLRTSNLAGAFIGPIRIKPIKNFGEKGAWAYPGTAKIFWVPLAQERVQLRTSNVVGTFIGLIGTKDHENVGNSIAVGVVRESRKFRAPIYSL